MIVNVYDVFRFNLPCEHVYYGFLNYNLHESLTFWIIMSACWSKPFMVVNFHKINICVISKTRRLEKTKTKTKRTDNREIIFTEENLRNKHKTNKPKYFLVIKSTKYSHIDFGLSVVSVCIHILLTYLVQKAKHFVELIRYPYRNWLGVSYWSNIYSLIISNSCIFHGLRDTLSIKRCVG